MSDLSFQLHGVNILAGASNKPVYILKFSYADEGEFGVYFQVDNEGINVNVDTVATAIKSAIDGLTNISFSNGTKNYVTATSF